MTKETPQLLMKQDGLACLCLNLHRGKIRIGGHLFIR